MAQNIYILVDYNNCMVNDKKPLNVTQKFVASMLENTQKTNDVRAQTNDVRAHSANDNVNPDEIDKVMMSIKKGVYRTK